MQGGLTSQQASDILKRDGYNSLPESETHNFRSIALSVLKEPMFLLLLGAGGIYFIIGDFIEALTISIFAMISVAIAITQEWRSENVLKALKNLSAPQAIVMRDNLPHRIEASGVVIGDVIILSEGDRIPADADIISSEKILIDESILTGESVAIEKSQGENIFSGTLIVRGQSRALVTYTGISSQIGKIGQALHNVKPEQPRLKAEMIKIIRFFATLSFILSITCILLYGLLRDQWLDGILNGIALGMALLPEEFPLVLVVFMSMGAWRISKVRVLTRKATSIETLGSATVLCTDKTGTLTENRMSIAFLKSRNESWSSDSDKAPTEEIAALLNAGRMASHKDSFDPMDKAFVESDLISSPLISNDKWYSLKPDLLMTAGAFKNASGFDIYAKGAPETIAKACALSPEETTLLHKDIESLAQRGLRVLAVAKAKSDLTSLPETAAHFQYEYLGLAGFADPLRKDVPAAIQECKTAGIRVVMITGDYPVTACSIAAQAGLDNPTVLTGSEIAGMDETELQQHVKTINIFARIMPEQKLRIVNALKANGEIVAMTGDGVNDAPSLKAANIGVAMGGRGTDVAREAASIILLDNNFASLVKTISLGRRIYDNLRKAMIYICAVHIPIAGIALLPLLFNFPLILTPLLIALMEMVIDPACSVILEAEEAEENVMQRPPRNPLSPMLPLPVLAWGMAQGAIAMGLLLGVWGIAYSHATTEDDIRSLAIMGLLSINIALILVNRTFSSSPINAVRKHNPSLGWGIAGIFVIFILLFAITPVRHLFSLGVPETLSICYALASGIILFAILEFMKGFFRKRIEI